MISKWSQKTVGPLVSARELACSYTGRPGSFTWCDWPPRVSPLAWLWHTWGAAGPLPLESGSHIHMDAASVVHKRLVPLSTGPGLGEEGPGPSLCPGSGQPPSPGWSSASPGFCYLPGSLPSWPCSDCHAEEGEEYCRPGAGVRRKTWPLCQACPCTELATGVSWTVQMQTS